MKDGFPPRQLPSPDRIEVWKIAESVSGALAGAGRWLDGVLTEEERARAGRFHRAADARRFRLCRALLRLGLGWYLGQPPRALELRQSEAGKPYLAPGGRDRSGAQALRFNVAHAEGMALIAFATAGEVGVDVEPARREVEALALARQYFTEREQALVEAAGTEPEQTRIFLRLWTRKEAVLKAAGWGILRGLAVCDVCEPEAGLVEVRGDAARGGSWRLRDLAVGEGFLAAVAGPAGDWVIQPYEFAEEEAIRELVGRGNGAD